MAWFDRLRLRWIRGSELGLRISFGLRPSGFGFGGSRPDLSATLEGHLQCDAREASLTPQKPRYPYLYGLDGFCPTRPATVGEKIEH